MHTMTKCQHSLRDTSYIQENFIELVCENKKCKQNSGWYFGITFQQLFFLLFLNSKFNCFWTLDNADNQIKKRNTMNRMRLQKITVQLNYKH